MFYQLLAEKRKVEWLVRPSGNMTFVGSLVLRFEAETAAQLEEYRQTVEQVVDRFRE